MITIKPKTRSAIKLRSLEELLPYLKKFSKNWKTLTPQVSSRLEKLLSEDRFFPSMYHFGKTIRKDILEMRSGTFSKQHYIEIFGWAEQSADDFFIKKIKLFKESTGCFTPGMKEFWIKHHNMDDKDAEKAVSEAQRRLSIRKKKTTINQPTSLAYYLYRGASEEEAIKLQSEVQKKRRNNCVEYLA